MPDALVNFRLDDEDRTLLEACCAKEKLKKSDILRRALRLYAVSIGVGPEPEKPKPRKR